MTVSNESTAAPETRQVALEDVKPSSAIHADVLASEVVERKHLDGTVDLVDVRAIGGDIDQMPPGYFGSIHFLGTVVAISLGAICAYLSWVMPANTLGLINESIGPSPNINWVATSWTLGNSISYLLFGRLSDIFGRRWLTIAANALTLVACIVAGTASRVDALIAANTLNGFAAAVQLSFPLLLGELVANKHRGPISALVFLAVTPFGVFGPAFARLFILNTAAGWRWNFYLGIIFSGITTLLLFFFYHPPRYSQLHVQGKSSWQQVKELDHGGLFLLVAGTVLFLVGLSWGGQVYPWRSAEVVCTIVIGGLCLIAFGLYEEEFVVKGHGLMPPRIFKNTGFSAVVVTSTVGGMVYYSMSVLWPTILAGVYTTDTMDIGWKSSVQGGGTILGQVIGAVAIGTSAGAAAFFAALASMNTGNEAQIIVMGILASACVGWVDNIGFVGVSLLFEPEDIGLVFGVLGSIRTLGGAVAQALYVSVLTNKLTHYLPKYVVPAAIESGLPESSLKALFAAITTGNFGSVPGITPDIIAAVSAQVKHAYLSSFRVVFLATIPFGTILLVASFWVPNFDQFLHLNVAKRLQFKGRGHEQEQRETS
ncbi:hypothetical protein LTS17_010380 [Exophiala oligosperma]